MKMYRGGNISSTYSLCCRSQWPRGLRHRSTAARLLRSWVRIPPGTWMSVCCECCVLSGRGLCDGLITRPEESYRLWRVVVCDQETSNEEAKACYGVVENTTKRIVTPRKQQQTNALRYIYLWFVGPCCFITVMSVRKFFPQTRGSRTRNPICQ